jgi:hypothetical protein
MAAAMSRSEKLGSLKGKHGLALSLPAHRLLQGVGGREIDLHAEQIVQPVLQSHHVQQRVAAVRLEFSDPIGDRLLVGDELVLCATLAPSSHNTQCWSRNLRRAAPVIATGYAAGATAVAAGRV